MSFIDLMANDIWSEADIVRRTEAMIRSAFSAEQEAILNRIATGAALGQYQMSEQETLNLTRYAQVSEDARQAGDAARQDMALLLQVFAVEAAQRRLDQPAVEPETDEQGNVTNQDELDADEQERAAAQDVIDNASPEVMAVIEQRRPDDPEETGNEVTE